MYCQPAGLYFTNVGVLYTHNYIQTILYRMKLYRKLVIICPPTLSQKWGGAVYSNIQLALTILPPAHTHTNDCYSFVKKGSIGGHAPWEISNTVDTAKRH